MSRPPRTTTTDSRPDRAQHPSFPTPSQSSSYDQLPPPPPHSQQHQLQRPNSSVPSFEQGYGSTGTPPRIESSTQLNSIAPSVRNAPHTNDQYGGRRGSGNLEYDDDDDDADFYARPASPPRSMHPNPHPQQLYTPAPFNDSQASSGGPIKQSNTPSPPPLLDHSHLRPGAQASLLSYERTLALYRENAKKTNLPEVQYEFAVFMIDAVKGLPIPTLATAGQIEIEKITEKREEMVREATGLLKKLADRGHPDSQYFLADCYANGIGTVRGRQDFDRAFPLFVLAAKHGHSEAAYRSGTCCENGWGCRRESSKAVQFYRKAAAASHPGAMYRLGMAELNGELGLAKSPREGVKWLKRSTEHANAEFPHALHELALLHEKGISNVLFVDHEYAAELLAQASELGYAPSAYRLGECYEYGKMGCPQDPALSIHYYVSVELMMTSFRSSGPTASAGVDRSPSYHS